MAESSKRTRVRELLTDKARGALLAAAIGDALGWPQEDRSKRVDRLRNNEITPLFQTWTRREGNRFNPYLVTVEAGEYSDDTQLILCTARSRASTQNWWQKLVSQELPTWRLYQRGGGGATVRSVDSWLKGKAPWDRSRKIDDVRKYFEAGGNGVAMRILPHCVIAADYNNFDDLAKAIVADGVTTHGHPRALVGALLYGFVLWQALRQTKTLKYGELVEIAMKNAASWSQRPDISDYWKDWNDSQGAIAGEQYEKIWQDTVHETLELLYLCQDGLKQEALSIDREVLDRIGTFGNQKGSGTITAVGAVFLASRYAADPLHGMLESAFAIGADTDTLCSMASAILGAICGSEWLQPYVTSVQDSNYLSAIADQLAERGDLAASGSQSVSKVSKTSLDTFWAHLMTVDTGNIDLPDGRHALVLGKNEIRDKGKLAAWSWKLNVSDGQTIYLEKTPSKQESYRVPALENDQMILQLEKPAAISNTINCVKVPVSDLEKAHKFYREVLGLVVTKVQSGYRIDDKLNLVAMQDAKEFPQMLRRAENRKSRIGPVLSIATLNIEEVYNRVRAASVEVLGPISKKPGCKFFRCCDFDGNLIEVVQGV